MEKVAKINMGSGEDYREDYLNVDNQAMFPNAKVDVKSNIEDYSVPDNSVDEILLSHVAMYLRPEEIQPLLKKWYGFLKPQGILEVETSDFKKLAKIISSNYSQSMTNSHGLINIFGNSKAPPHRWGWSIPALKDELYQAGFTRLKVSRGEKKPDRDFKIIAIK